MTHKFPLGREVASSCVADWIDETTGPGSRYGRVVECLARHAAGDWGEVGPDDAALNDEALLVGNRLMSVYTVDDRKIWVITEADRSVTTVLFPEEY